MPTRLTRVLVLGVALFAGAGCDRMRDVKRCRALAHQVNASLDRIETASKGEKTRAAYDMISTEYESLAKGLDGYDAGTPELTKSVEDYASVARMSARQSSTLAEALGANNRATATLATHELERLARQQKAIVMRIDEECRPK